EGDARRGEMGVARSAHRRPGSGTPVAIEHPPEIERRRVRRASARGEEEERCEERRTKSCWHGTILIQRFKKKRFLPVAPVDQSRVGLPLWPSRTTAEKCCRRPRAVAPGGRVIGPSFRYPVRHARQARP